MAKSVYTPAYRHVVERVVALRKRAGLTQRELAAKLGWPQNLVARLETTQRRLDLVEFVAICEACGADRCVESADLAKALRGGVRLKPLR